MPFVKKNDPRSSQPAADIQKLFVGRANELHFFREHILKPEDPAYNIISVYGDGGVGKSTLIARIIDEAGSPEYREYCLTARVDERQATAASMIEKFASQLHMRNNFKRALARYKDAMYRLQAEQETMQDAVLQRAPDFAGAAVEGVPFVGPLLREGVKMTTEHVLHSYGMGQGRRAPERLDDPIGELTAAFVAELNRLADTQVTLAGQWARRRYRILLFFDTFEQLAVEAAPWLLDHFLVSDISNSVVLITAGRIPIERSLPDDPKRWLPYRDNHVIYSIGLNSFTEEETRAYLEQRGITDPARVTRIWQLSHGLPLYLSLLPSDPQYEIDPTADVVANFLRWIPEEEALKRRLVLDASLFSRPFNQDELTALSYIPEQERAALYHWLIRQSFVLKSAQDGRYSYHELAEDLFSRHFYLESPNACYATRRALVAYYRRCLEDLQEHGGKAADIGAERLSLTMALARQLFLLPDESCHLSAIEQLLEAYHSTKQDEEIIRALRDLFQDQLYNLANADAREAARLLAHYIEAEPMSQDFVVAASRLLKKIEAVPSFSPALLARIYSNRGIAYRELNEPEKALEDFNRAIALDPDDARAYGNRGITQRALKQYEQALSDLNRALSLDDTMDWVHVARGEVYRHIGEYQRALEDFNRALAIDPDYAAAYAGRGRVYYRLKQYDQAARDLEHGLAIDPEMAWAYGHLGEAYRGLQEYDRAIEEYNRAIALVPGEGYFWAYASRGLTFYYLGEYQRALADLDHAIALNADYAWGYAHRGRIYRHLKQYEKALADLDRSIALDPNDAWTYSHRGLTYLALGQYDHALEDLNRAIELNPAYWQNYGRRASVYLYLKDLESAAADYARDCAASTFNIRSCWMKEWIALREKRGDAETAERLEAIASTVLQRRLDPRRSTVPYFVAVCRGVALWLRGQSDPALAKMAEARALDLQMWDAPFWEGMIYATPGRAEAVELWEQALALGMPSVLLAPLRWLEQDQPDFYVQYAAPLLARYA
jgi:tetratricopeptide (TPR) repeat protein